MKPTAEMKEKIIEICKIVEIHIQESDNYECCIGTGYFTDRFKDVVDLIGDIIASEADRIIEERMPEQLSIEMEAEDYSGKEDCNKKQFIDGNEFDAFVAGCDWFRNRIKGKQ